MTDSACFGDRGDHGLTADVTLDADHRLCPLNQSDLALFATGADADAEVGSTTATDRRKRADRTATRRARPRQQLRELRSHRDLAGPSRRLRPQAWSVPERRRSRMLPRSRSRADQGRRHRGLILGPRSRPGRHRRPQHPFSTAEATAIAEARYRSRHRLRLGACWRRTRPGCALADIRVSNVGPSSRRV